MVCAHKNLRNTQKTVWWVSNLNVLKANPELTRKRSLDSENGFEAFGKDTYAGRYSSSEHFVALVGVPPEPGYSNYYLDG